MAMEENVVNKFLQMLEQSSDPLNVLANIAQLWLSDGTGTGDTGDLYTKVHQGGDPGSNVTRKWMDHTYGRYFGESYASADGVVTLVITDFNLVTATLAEDTTYNATGGHIGQQVTFILTEDGTGGWSVTFGTNFESLGVRTAAAGEIITASFVYDGSNWCEVGQAAPSSSPSQWGVTEMFLGDGVTTIALPETTTHLRLRSYKGYTVIDYDDQGGTYYDVMGDGTFIFTIGTGGISSHTFNGTTFTYLDNIANGGYSIWCEGGFIFTANGANGLFCYSVDGAGNLTLEDSIDDGGYANCVWGNGSRVFIANGTDGIRSYTYAGGTLVNVGHIADAVAGNGVISVGGDETHIYAVVGDQGGGTGGINAYTYIADAFVNVGHYTVDAGTDFITAFNDYIHCADGVIFYTYPLYTWPPYVEIGEFGALTFDGADFTYLYSSNNPTRYEAGLWYEEGYLHITYGRGGFTGAIYAYPWYGETLLDAIDSLGSSVPSYGVWGDGDFIYICKATSGILAVTFDGQNVIETITGGVPGQLLTIEGTDDGVTFTDTDAHTENTMDLIGTATDIVSADDKLLQLSFNGTSWYQTAPVSGN